MRSLVDLHTHILPDVDDGADSMEESVKMVQSLNELGFEHIFVTPHHRLYSWEGLPAERIESGIIELERALSAKSLKLQLYPGIEYDLDDTLPQRAQDRPGGADHLLVDIGFWDVPSDLEGLLERVRELGVDIFLVHPERNSALCRRKEKLRSLSLSGFRFVGNLGSLSGFYGNGVKKNALNILKAGYYWAMASDLHSCEQVSWVSEGLKKLRQQAGLSVYQDLVSNNPMEIAKSMMEGKS